MYGISDTATPIKLLDLVEVIKEVDNKGMVPFSITQITKFATNKSSFPKFVLEGYANNGGETSFAKISQLNGSLNISYAKAVNRHRVEEGLAADFVPKATNTYDTITKAVKSKGVAPNLSYYLFYYPNFVSPDFESVVFGRDPETQKMKLINLEDPEIKAILKPERPEKVGRQGVEDEVVVRTLSFSSIAAIRLNKVDYVISDLDPVRAEIFEAIFAK
jgi:hypothetical protein